MMPEVENKPPLPPQGNRIGDQDAHQLRLARNLTMVASFAGPISLFIGGMFLSSVGLVCALVGWRKLKRLVEKGFDVERAARPMKRSCVIAMSICAVALVLNAVTFAIMYPIVLEALETGDYGNLLGNGNGSSSSSGSSSTWG